MKAVTMNGITNIEHDRAKKKRRKQPSSCLTISRRLSEFRIWITHPTLLLTRSFVSLLPLHCAVRCSSTNVYVLCAFSSGIESLHPQLGPPHPIYPLSHSHSCPPQPFILWFILILTILMDQNDWRSGLRMFRRLRVPSSPFFPSSQTLCNV